MDSRKWRDGDNSVCGNEMGGESPEIGNEGKKGVVGRLVEATRIKT